MKLLFSPIRASKIRRNSSGDVEIDFEIFPEAFRMLTYLYLIFFMALGTIITILFADTDFTDNPIINRFGENNICIMFDDPPFSLFGSTLWYPATILWLSFELFDYIRVYDHYIDDDPTYHDQYPITKGFWIYYTVSTVMESLCSITFAQVFATSPVEHMYMHSWAYMGLMFCLWLLVLKRYLYLKCVGLQTKLHTIFVVVCSITTIINYGIIIPNLYHARLWESYPWTSPLVTVNNRLYIVLHAFVPMVIYGFVGNELDTVLLTFRRVIWVKGTRTETETETGTETVTATNTGTFTGITSTRRITETEMQKSSGVSRVTGLMRHLFQPISEWKTLYSKSNEMIKVTRFVTHPDSFRMCFYIYISLFLAVACFVTWLWGTIDLDDNIMVRRFGYSAFSVRFSDPPFSFFASTLWFPATILLLSFEVTDYLRVYFHYLDDCQQNPISKGFVAYYSVSTLIESLSVIWESQVFASSPSEHIYMHSVPYVTFAMTLCMMIGKQYLYHRKIGVTPRYGMIHVTLCLFTTLIAVALHLPNLFGAKLWQSYPWTMSIQKINDVLYAMLVVVAPMVVYGLIGKKLDTVIVTLKRARNGAMANEEMITATQSLTLRYR